MTYKLKEFGDALRQHIAQQLQNPFEDMPRRSFLTGGRGGRSKIAARGRDPASTSSPAPSEGSQPKRGESGPAVMLGCGAGEAKRKRGRPRKGEKK